MNSDNPQPLPLLASGARLLGFDLSARQLEQFQLYYETLVEWNSRVNLTAITGYDAVQVRHFLDSLTVGAALLEELGRKIGERAASPPPGTRLLDVGTGAGFPGVPLKIVWPQIHAVLADSIGKKTSFLSALSASLGLRGVEVITARAEELGQNKQHRQQYTAVTARAVASLPVLCEYCLPLVKVGGWMLAPKKGDISLELEGAKKATSILGGGEPRLHRFALPGEDEERFVVAIKKVKGTPPGYPRRVGLAKAQPLGSG
ncbi:MAG TPA: 16S rRNA (guanine(527)-N(7))-methyltransferase RsmG [Chloroflexia bacterium]|nr:16S rRNA (guanine(527)-N(7))-methyltransferase RsmG [Chloroflexia bacterium]